MKNSVLELFIEPTSDSNFITTTSIKIKFRYTNGESDNSDWNILCSSIDYKPTIFFLNSFLDFNLEKRLFTDYLCINGTPLWQFVPAHTWPSFFRCIELIRILRPLIEKNLPSRIETHQLFDSTYRIWEGVLVALGKHYGVPVHFRSQQLWPLLQSPISVLRQIGRYASFGFHVDRILRQILAYLFYFLGLMQRDHPTNGGTKKAMFVTIPRHWTQIPGDELSYYDEQFSPLIPEFKKKGFTNFIGIECPYGSIIKSCRSILSRTARTECSIKWKVFYSYSPSRSPESNQNKRSFLDTFNKIKNNTEFLDQFKFQGISLMPALEHELYLVFKYLLPRIMETLEIARKIIEIETPSVIGLSYETGEFERALIIEAKKRNIPTFGLMHGMIFDNHYDYMHRGITNKIEASNHFIVPDVTFVWGQFWKRILTEKGYYSSNLIKVTGSWRYDTAATLMSDSKIKNNLRQTYHIPQNKKVVLILTANQDIMGFIETCLNVIKNFPQYFSIFKLHPADNPKLIYNLLNQNNIPLRSIFTGHLISALSIGDLVISQISTAIGEAAIMNKPTILVDFQNMTWHDYSELGICLRATTKRELDQAILKIENPETQVSLQNAREQFIRDHYFAMDGKAAQRVVEETIKISLT